MSKIRKDNDRERILCNIAAILASELHALHLLPAVQAYVNDDNMGHRVKVKSGTFRKEPYEKGALVACWTSTGRQQNPFLISFVAENGIENDPRGLVLRAIGTNDLCMYGNESFIEITGIQEEMLWEGEKRRFAQKVMKAYRKISDWGHRFRKIEFVDDSTALIWVGEAFGGLRKRSKPYSITTTWKRVTIKHIEQVMLAQGYGTRQFEPEE